jgi:hypothetical protein
MQETRPDPFLSDPFLSLADRCKKQDLTPFSTDLTPFSIVSRQIDARNKT